MSEPIGRARTHASGRKRVAVDKRSLRLAILTMLESRWMLGARKGKKEDK